MLLKGAISPIVAMLVARASTFATFEAEANPQGANSAQSKPTSEDAADFSTMLYTIIVTADVISAEIGLEYDDKLATTLGWYPHISLAVHTTSDGPASRSTQRPIFRFTLLAGPQIQTVDGDVRGLVAAAPQWWLFENMMVGADGGYTFGTDGSGPHAGASVGAGVSDTFAFVLTARRTWLADHLRNSAGIDLRIFWTDVWTL
jgi:hypothetical protein